MRGRTVNLNPPNEVSTATKIEPSTEISEIGSYTEGRGEGRVEGRTLLDDRETVFAVPNRPVEDDS